MYLKRSVDSIFHESITSIVCSNVAIGIRRSTNISSSVGIKIKPSTNPLGIPIAPDSGFLSIKPKNKADRPKDVIPQKNKNSSSHKPITPPKTTAKIFVMTNRTIQLSKAFLYGSSISYNDLVASCNTKAPMNDTKKHNITWKSR